MKTFEIISATGTPNGYGHKKIEVVIAFYNKTVISFKSTTDNMIGYDNAMELEDQERRDALYRLIEKNIKDQVEDYVKIFE